MLPYKTLFRRYSAFLWSAVRIKRYDYTGDGIYSLRELL